ncbi:ferredoxin, partial [Streptomyces sp. KR55]|uniref:ferredoxin n=1 Tax=Streptomyces sp. KR55 TaxID=3457425 RepID=UPI003FD37BA1
MELRVDRDKCGGTGQCALFLPAVFDQSEDDGKVLLLTPLPSADLAGSVRTAARRCPTGAIT